MRTSNAVSIKSRAIISRTSSDQEDDYFSFRVEDELSGLVMLELKMTPEQFSRVITGSWTGDIAGKYFMSANIGKRLETKTVAVPLEYKAGRGADFAACHTIATAPFEVDGWKANIDKVFNGHRRGEGTYSTNFRRWAEDNTDDK